MNKKSLILVLTGMFFLSNASFAAEALGTCEISSSDKKYIPGSRAHLETYDTTVLVPVEKIDSVSDVKKETIEDEEDVENVKTYKMDTSQTSYKKARHIYTILESEDEPNKVGDRFVIRHR